MKNNKKQLGCIVATPALVESKMSCKEETETYTEETHAPIKSPAVSIRGNTIEHCRTRYVQPDLSLTTSKKINAASSPPAITSKNPHETLMHAKQTPLLNALTKTPGLIHSVAATIDIGEMRSHIKEIAGNNGKSTNKRRVLRASFVSFVTFSLLIANSLLLTFNF